jgi:hypothetical protein
VKIKPGLAADQKKAEEREEQAKTLPKVKIHLFDRTGKAVSNAPYEVSFFGYHDEGKSADGTVEVPAFPDVEKAHVRWGRPKDQRENPNDPEPYEFEMDVFMAVDHPDEDEALRRKLHNLGHQGGELHEAVHKLQAALGKERSGVSTDVKDEAESRHGDVKPSRSARRELEHGVADRSPRETAHVPLQDATRRVHRRVGRRKEGPAQQAACRSICGRDKRARRTAWTAMSARWLVARTPSHRPAASRSHS